MYEFETTEDESDITEFFGDEVVEDAYADYKNEAVRTLNSR